MRFGSNGEIPKFAKLSRKIKDLSEAKTSTDSKKMSMLCSGPQHLISCENYNVSKTFKFRTTQTVRCTDMYSYTHKIYLSCCYALVPLSFEARQGQSEIFR